MIAFGSALYAFPVVAPGANSAAYVPVLPVVLSRDSALFRERIRSWHGRRASPFRSGRAFRNSAQRLAGAYCGMSPCPRTVDVDDDMANDFLFFPRSKNNIARRPAI